MNKRSTVYIVQEPMRREGGIMVPVMDFRKAGVYGDLKVCLPQGRVALSPSPTEQALREALHDFEEDKDYIVAVGDPSAIFMTAFVLADMGHKKCNLLKWDKNGGGQYILVEFNLRRKFKED